MPPRSRWLRIFRRGKKVVIPHAAKHAQKRTLQCPKRALLICKFPVTALFQSIRFIDFITLALVNVKLLDEFRLSFLL